MVRPTNQYKANRQLLPVRKNTQDEQKYTIPFIITIRAMANVL